jgi:hypothetical protein
MNKTRAERKKNKIERKEKFARVKKYWLLYFVLIGTACLSAAAGILLAHIPDEFGVIMYNLASITAAIYYCAGFLSIGEGATWFWFGKLTDHDEDNTPQIIIAWMMLSLAVATSLTTAVAAASMIAFLMGELDQFPVIPPWAQKWIVWSIPFMWVAHFIAGTIFRFLADEEKQLRILAATQRDIEQEMKIEAAQETARSLRENAMILARDAGRVKAEEMMEYWRERGHTGDAQPITPGRNGNEPESVPITRQ